VRDPRLRPFRLPLAVFGAFVALQAGSGAVLFAAKLGLRPERLAAYYRGSEEAFGTPRSLAGLLEVAVPHLVAIPLVLFVTLHLVAIVGLLRRRPFALLAGLSFGCAATGVLAAFGIRWLSPGIAWVKLAAFVGLEASLGVWLLLLAAAFVPPRGASAASQARSGDGGAAGSSLRDWAARAAAAPAARARRAPGSAR